LTLLKEIQPLLPKPEQKRTMLLGDSEFRAVEVQRYCRRQGWGWQLGVKSDTLYHRGDGLWQPLSSIPIEPGQRRYLHDLTLTQRAAFGPVHLLVDWTYQTETPRYLVCHQPTSRHTWRWGRKRFWIEPLFRDWKSYGFDLETSHLDHDQRLDHLLLGFAVATLWLLHLGHWVIVSGRRHWLQAHHRHDYSLFRLGRDYARRSQLCGWFVPICLQR
jgi:hypothetical protein